MLRITVKIFYILIVLFSTNVYGIEGCATNEQKVELTDRVYKLEKENAILKMNIDTFISENDKKFTALTWPLGLIVTLLLIIFGIGAFRSIYLAKQEARKAFKEDFEKIKMDIESLKKEAEKELAEILTLKEIAKSKIE